jgi:hypothetical protein
MQPMRYWAWARYVGHEAAHIGVRPAFIDLFAPATTDSRWGSCRPPVFVEDAYYRNDVEPMLEVLYSQPSFAYWGQLVRYMDKTFAPRSDSLFERGETKPAGLSLWNTDDMAASIGARGLLRPLVRWLLQRCHKCEMLFRYAPDAMTPGHPVFDRHIEALVGKECAKSVLEEMAQAAPHERHLVLFERIAETVRSGYSLLLPYTILDDDACYAGAHVLMVTRRKSIFDAEERAVVSAAIYSSF